MAEVICETCGKIVPNYILPQGKVLAMCPNCVQIACQTVKKKKKNPKLKR